MERNGMGLALGPTDQSCNVKAIESMRESKKEEKKVCAGHGPWARRQHHLVSLDAFGCSVGCGMTSLALGALQLCAIRLPVAMQWIKCATKSPGGVSFEPAHHMGESVVADADHAFPSVRPLQPLAQDGLLKSR